MIETVRMGAAAQPRPRRRIPHAERTPRASFPPLSFATRVILLVAGWFLVLLGVIGWFLPVLQGWLTLFAGLAVLSLASQSFHRFLRRRFQRWPRGWRRLEKARRRMGRWLGRRKLRD